MRHALLALSTIALAASLAACDEVNPPEFQGNAKDPKPTRPEPGAPLPQLTRATEVHLALSVDEHNEPDDNVILVNRSNGALYDVLVTVNSDYTFTVPLIERGQTVRVPETWFYTKDHHPFPSARRVRMERVEVRHRGKLQAFFDARGYDPPAE